MLPNKAFIVFFLYVMFPPVAASSNRTTYRAADDGKYITTVEAEGDTIWYGSSTGLVCFNKVNGTFDRFTIKNGLIDNAVNDIATDIYGVKWIATESGVSQFDGTTWTSYASDEYFYGKKIHSVTVDNNNVKWFAARTVIVSYDGQKWQEFREPHNDKRMNLISVCSDKTGIIWFGSEHKGVVSFDGSEWNYYDNFEDLYNLKFVTIDVDENNVKWFGIFDGRLISYNGNEWTVQRVVESSNPRLYDLAVERNNGLWAATNKGLHHINEGSITVFEHNDAVFNSSLRSLTFDTEGMLWIGGYLGISKFDGSHYRESTLLRGPVRNTIVSIAFGPENVKWFGHTGRGISKYDGTFWSAHIHDYADLGHSIAIDQDNIVWVTAGWDGAISFDGFNVNNFYFNLGYESINAPISEVIVDNNNIVWFSGYRDYAIGESSYTVTVINNEISDYFHFMYLFLSPDGDLWRNNYSGITSYYSNDEWKYYVKNDFAFKEIDIDNNGTVWFIARGEMINYILYNKIITYDGNIWTTYTKGNSGLSSSFISSIAIDHNNTKWIGTDAGVSRFDGETWTTFNRSNSGLCDNKVNAIAVEKNNTIWFGTDNGVSRYTGEIITTSVDEEDEKPEALPVLHSYPNPFNPSTTIEFTLPESGFTTLSIYNISGQKVRELAAGHMTAGMHSLIWDGRDDSGDAVSSGIYITRLAAGKQVAARRMILLK